MKTTLAGLVAAIIIASIGFIALRSSGLIKLPTRSPSPSPSVSPNFELAPLASSYPSVAPSASPEPSVKPSTKGGVILGEDESDVPLKTARPTVRPAPSQVASTTTTTTTTTRIDLIRLLETKSCPLDATLYLREISQDYNIKYSLKDGFAAKLQIWKTTGEELLKETEIKGSGIATKLTVRGDVKFHVVSANCSSTDDTWLKLTAEK